MSVLELKTELHKRIDAVDDEEQLQHVLSLLADPESPDDVEIAMTPEWEARLKKTAQDIQEGRFTSHEQVQSEIREWLRNKQK